ncbi:Maf family protein [Paenibacillus sp. ACRRX]|uniref:Maf family protein n=1 Tax=unclassified Paenibacillus TaxID=185978 RepID=UPI001EF4CC63|nr:MULTISPECIES: Maf family protein [unclassified Paenibacillus]MCG7410201.1 Maf family protein [Paenibacillus sp. ACRRX]MDK8183784.1 Maf family protein [Paenibacillus sp. UMB4589-SE434]
MENIQQNNHVLPLLVLASSSPRRQELIQTFGLPYVVEPSDADESLEEHWTPQDTVEQLALRKASTIVEIRQARRDEGIVIGSDTVVVHDRMILGKPHDDSDAFRMLSMLQGKAHDVFTGVACIDVRTGNTLVRHRHTRVWMRHLNNAQIERYIASGEPRDKAGSYGIQGLGATIVDRIEGCYFNVVGLPVSLLAEMLTAFAIEKP